MKEGVPSPGKLAAVLALGLGLRLACLFLTPSPAVPESDGLRYDAVAANVLAGRGVSVDGKSPTTACAPGYPWFLAGVYALAGHGYNAVYAVQILLSLLTGLLACAACAEFLPPPAGLTACLLVMAAPGLVGFTKWIWSETLAAFLLSASFFFLISGESRARAWRCALAGALAGLATLARPVTLLWPAALLGVSLLPPSDRGRAWRAGAFCLAACAVLAPWVVRNYKLSGRWIAVESEMGTSLWAGNWPGGGGAAVLSKDEEPLKSLLRGRDPRDPGADRDMTRFMLGYIAEHPREFIALYFRKIAAIWLSGQTASLRLYPAGTEKRDLWRRGAYGVLAVIALGKLMSSSALAAAVLGFLTAPEGARPLNRLVAGGLLYFTLVAGFFAKEPRFCLPFWPVLAVLSAQGILWSLRRFGVTIPGRGI